MHLLRRACNVARIAPRKPDAQAAGFSLRHATLCVALFFNSEVRMEQVVSV
jgi:hypothetical protein